MKLCINCKHYHKSVFPSSTECSSPNNIKEINLVEGSETYAWLSARYIRREEAFCGKDGRWFEPRKK